MPATAQQIRDRLLQVIDTDGKETRLGKYVNLVRRAATDPGLEKRAKKLIKSWQKMISVPTPPRGTPPVQPKATIPSLSNHTTTLKNHKITSSNHKVTLSNHKVTSSNQNVTSSSQKIVASNQKGMSLNRKVTSSKQKVTSSNQKIASSNQKVSSSNQKVMPSAANHKVPTNHKHLNHKTAAEGNVKASMNKTAHKPPTPPSSRPVVTNGGAGGDVTAVKTTAKRKHSKISTTPDKPQISSSAKRKCDRKTDKLTGGKSARLKTSDKEVTPNASFECVAANGLRVTLKPSAATNKTKNSMKTVKDSQPKSSATTDSLSKSSTSKDSLGTSSTIKDSSFKPSTEKASAAKSSASERLAPSTTNNDQPNMNKTGVKPNSPPPPVPTSREVTHTPPLLPPTSNNNNLASTSHDDVAKPSMTSRSTLNSSPLPVIFRVEDDPFFSSRLWSTTDKWTQEGAIDERPGVEGCRGDNGVWYPWHESIYLKYRHRVVMDDPEDEGLLSILPYVELE